MHIFSWLMGFALCALFGYCALATGLGLMDPRLGGFLAALSAIGVLFFAVTADRTDDR